MVGETLDEISSENDPTWIPPIEEVLTKTLHVRVLDSTVFEWEVERVSKHTVTSNSPRFHCAGLEWYATQRHEC